VDYRRERRLIVSGDILSVYPLDGDWSAVRREYWWQALATVPLPSRPAVLLVGLGGGTQLHLLRALARFLRKTLQPVELEREIVVDVRRAEVTRAGEPADLSAREFKLLRYFIEHRGATLSRDALLSHVWGYDDMPLTRTVDVHVAGLRQKLESNPKAPEYIVTVHGLGYKFIG